jgi:hypothetical protein
MESKDTFILIFTKPEWKMPIVVNGDTIDELCYRVDNTIKDEGCDVSIAARTDDVDRNEVQEIASMLLIKGHRLVQNDLYVQVDIFAKDNSGRTIESWCPTVSSISEKTLDSIYDSLFGNCKQQALLTQVKELRYGYFNPHITRDWSKLVGYKVEKHFNKRLKGRKTNGKTN